MIWMFLLLILLALGTGYALGVSRGAAIDAKGGVIIHEGEAYYHHATSVAGKYVAALEEKIKAIESRFVVQFKPPAVSSTIAIPMSNSGGAGSAPPPAEPPPTAA